MRIVRGPLTLNNLCEVFHQAGLSIDVVETWDLNQPSNVMREEFIVDDPFGQLVPFCDAAAVDADAPFAVLQVLASEVL